MSTQGNNALFNQIEARGLRVGNVIKVADVGLETATTASTHIYSDSSSKLAAGAFPFTIATNLPTTASSVLSIEGQATGTANDLMHLTLVKGANATATIAGYYRVTVTDDAGVITTGDYYAPFYTLG